MALLDLDPRYEEALRIEAIVISRLLAVLQGAWQAAGDCVCSTFKESAPGPHCFTCP